MQLLRSSILAAAALLGTGCIKEPTTAPVPRNYVLHAPVDKVWTALLETVTDLNMPISNIDRASWFYRTPTVYNAGNYLDCGTAMSMIV